MCAYYKHIIFLEYPSKYIYSDWPRKFAERPLMTKYESHVSSQPRFVTLLSFVSGSDTYMVKYDRRHS